MKSLNMYRSHKVVRAMLIINITDVLGDSSTVTLHGGEGRFRNVSSEYVKKHAPTVGGYYVIYEDGYESYSPAEAFESGYLLIHPDRQPDLPGDEELQIKSEESLEESWNKEKKDVPSVTEEMVESVILTEQYHVPDGTCHTLCTLTLRNGFTVVGESACVHPDRFNAELGRQYAREKAVDKVWGFEAYLLQQGLFDNEMLKRIAAIPEMAEARKEAQSRLYEGVEPLIWYIAGIAHEANAEYCRLNGDKSQVSWKAAPDWQKSSSIKGVILLFKNRSAPVSALHHSWCNEKREDGWVFGETKDADKKTHPCLVPFEDLPQEQQMKDYLFRSVVIAHLNSQGV